MSQIQQIQDDTVSLYKNTVLFFSVQVIVPLPSWDLNTKQPLTSDPEKYAVETELIYKYSPFKNEEQLMQQFNKIESSSGKKTLLVVNCKCIISQNLCFFLVI